MKWFKHQSDLRYDAKIRRLIAKHGVAGYGVYNFVLEAITMSLETDSPIPELEDTSQDIAEYLHMDTVKVEEILLFSLHQGLFEQSQTTGKILCNKIYKYIDKASTRSEELRKMISSYNSETVKECPRLSGTNHDKPDRTEQNKEQNKEQKIGPRQAFSKPSLYEVVQYCDERKNGLDAGQFVDHYEANGWKVGGKTPMKDWKACIRTWERREDSKQEFNGNKWNGNNGHKQEKYRQPVKSVVEGEPV